MQSPVSKESQIMVEGGIVVGHYLVLSLKQQRKLKTTMTKRIGKKNKVKYSLKIHFTFKNKGILLV